MFKVLAYLLLAAAALWYVVLLGFSLSTNPAPLTVAIPASAILWAMLGGIPMCLTAGVFLCIHKYLHKDDGRSYEVPRYSAPLPPPTAERHPEPRISNSTFGR